MMRSALSPRVAVIPEAFFQKALKIFPAFFQNGFRAGTARLKFESPLTFKCELPLDPKTFSEVYAVDNSRLEKVARKLSVWRTTTKASIRAAWRQFASSGADRCTSFTSIRVTVS